MGGIRRPSRRAVVGGIGSLGAAALLGRAARAAGYPERAITILCPFAPGGPTDLCARIAAAHLGQKLGQPAVVENKVGAGGNIALSAAAKAKPDGYTLLVCSSAYVVNPALYTHSPFDPFKDFAPIAFFGASPNVIAIRTELGIKTIGEFIQRAKAQPDFFNYASPGAGTTPQLATEILKFRAGINVTHVPFNGAAPAIQAVLAGTTQLVGINLSSALPHIQAGTLTGLVQTGETRWPAMTQVPTMAEAGFDNAVSETFQALFAPAGTPEPILELLSREAQVAFEPQETRERLMQAGFAVMTKGPDYLRQRIALEVPQWKEAVKTAGVKVD
jgi:tripartite-type tricarboxylate transporter receptor subunit TctC